MKKNLLWFTIVISFITTIKVSAQNADEIIFNQYKSQFNYAAGSFVIDTGTSQVKFQKRGFLIWADNLQEDSINRYMSLSEYGSTLNFLTEQGNTSEKFGSIKNMFPKKIIKSKFAHVYYALGYVTNSRHTINGLTLYSSPTLYKIDGNTLGIIWARKINLPVISPNTTNIVIEYNDMIETRDKNIVLVGKYAANTRSKESVLATKISNAGVLMWNYIYNTQNTCNEAANSIAETKDGNLSLTGYIKKCTSPSFNGNNDVFYMQVKSTGTTIAGGYARFIWPTNLNMWADKITCYTSVAGSDQLIISGYVDVQNVTGAIDRQILIMNLKQGGALITAQHIGDPQSDVCNDLVFSKNGTSNSNYFIYLTGQTANYNSQKNVSAEVYFMFAQFNTGKGITALSEFSTYPVTTPPFNTYVNRTGLEIKNAGNYKKFAILANGTYVPGTTQTYTDVLIRDFNDSTGNCIKQQQPPVKQFSMDRKVSTPSFDTPTFKLYKESWIKLNALQVKKLCQSISINPSQSLSLKADSSIAHQSMQSLRISPNPANSFINISIIDGSSFTVKNNKLIIRIYNTAMQVEKEVSISSIQNNTFKMPVSQLKSGIYMLQLIRGNEEFGGTFIKE